MKQPAYITGANRADLGFSGLVQSFQSVDPVVISQGGGLLVVCFRKLALVERLDIKTVNRRERIIDFRIIDRRVGDQLVRIAIL